MIDNVRIKGNITSEINWLRTTNSWGERATIHKSTPRFSRTSQDECFDQLTRYNLTSSISRLYITSVKFLIFLSSIKCFINNKCCNKSQNRLVVRYSFTTNSLTIEATNTDVTGIKQNRGVNIRYLLVLEWFNKK